MTLSMKVGSQITFGVPAGVMVSSSDPTVISTTFVRDVCTIKALKVGKSEVSANYSDLFGGFNCEVVA